jgi:uncharacterized protein (DUF1501 family)
MPEKTIMNNASISRRGLLQGAGCLMAAAMLPDIRVSFAAAPVEQRFIFVILRGAMDGLAAIPPYGDRDYKSARGGIALPSSAYTPLDDFYAAHNSLAGFAELFKNGEAAVIHAVATPYRDRSHFDAQNMLESGATRPNGLRDGWLNRAIALYGRREDSLGLAVGQTIPLALQGDIPVGTWAPSADGLPSDALLISLERLYKKDPVFHTALTQAVDVHNIADDQSGAMEKFGQKLAGRRGLQNREAMGKTVSAVAKILSDPSGPRIATIEVGGWDTHAQQGTERGPLANLLGALDNGLKTMKSSLGKNWDKTVILVATEFGRTVSQNGTNGTDHGTASCAFLAGGAVNGGRVYGDWPGLSKRDQHEGRDLRPTTDLRQAAKAVLFDHFGLKDADVERRVFPESGDAPAIEGIIKT